MEWTWDTKFESRQVNSARKWGGKICGFVASSWVKSAGPILAGEPMTGLVEPVWSCDRVMRTGLVRALGLLWTCYGSSLDLLDCNNNYKSTS